MFLLRRNLLRSSVGLGLGTSLWLTPRPVRNDAAVRHHHVLPTPKKHTFLDYDELCIGSVLGLFVGIVVGKLLTALVFLGAAGYMFLQFLENKGVVHVPWTAVFSFRNRQWDVKRLLFNKPNFKAAFLLSFLIAAFNI